MEGWNKFYLTDQNEVNHLTAYVQAMPAVPLDTAPKQWDFRLKWFLADYANHPSPGNEKLQLYSYFTRSVAFFNDADSLSETLRRHRELQSICKTAFPGAEQPWQLAIQGFWDVEEAHILFDFTQVVAAYEQFKHTAKYVKQALKAGQVMAPAVLIMAWTGAGRCFVQLKQQTQAETCFRKVLAFLPCGFWSALTITFFFNAVSGLRTLLATQAMDELVISTINSLIKHAGACNGWAAIRSLDYLLRAYMLADPRCAMTPGGCQKHAQECPHRQLPAAIEAQEFVWLDMQLQSGAQRATFSFGSAAQRLRKLSFPAGSAIFLKMVLLEATMLAQHVKFLTTILENRDRMPFVSLQVVREHLVAVHQAFIAGKNKNKEMQLRAAIQEELTSNPAFIPFGFQAMYTKFSKLDKNAVRALEDDALLSKLCFDSQSA
jgi:hypothetical protein